MQSAAKLGVITDIKANGHVDFSIEPEKPELGTIVDNKGDVVTGQHKTIMVKIDDKIKEPSGVSKGFLGMAAIILSIAVYTVTVAMNYQGNLSKVTEIDGRLTKLENAVVEMQKLHMVVNNIQNDVGTIKSVQKESEQDRKDILKSMGDIRILLAQKQMTQGN